LMRSSLRVRARKKLRPNVSTTEPRAKMTVQVRALRNWGARLPSLKRRA
jgi:hypothetical protein